MKLLMVKGVVVVVHTNGNVAAYLFNSDRIIDGPPFDLGIFHCYKINRSIFYLQ